MIFSDLSSDLDILQDRWRSSNGNRSKGRYPVLLAACATTDITQPYHSLSYLAGMLNKSGHPYLVRDFAIEFWHYLISPNIIETLRRDCIARLDSANADDRLMLRFYADMLADNNRFLNAFNTLRHPTKFYDLTSYLNAVHELNRLPWLLTLLSKNAEYRTFSSATPPGSKSDHINLEAMQREIKSGYGVEVVDNFYDGIAKQIAELDPCLVGLTVPFLSQLEHSLMLGMRLRKLGIKVAMGGPIPAKFTKYSDSMNNLKPLSFAVDYLVPGEGETLIGELAEALQNGGKTEGLVNMINLHSPKRLSRIHFENVDDLPSPDYSIWDYELYASPEPGALYSPTRGCYWNKCAFCDYGLAVGTPTSPWRTRSTQRVVEDLEAAAPYVRKFFFAVDVLSPSYAMKISQALIDHSVDIKWMADFRLESTFNIDKVAIFEKAGCIGAAFGMESADQEVLNSIDKGTDVTRLPAVVDAFANAGIPVQLMGFTGFPGETIEQANTTFKVANSLLNKVATVVIGKYGLSSGSLVAKNPSQYGVQILYEPKKEASIPWDINWRPTKDYQALSKKDFRSSLNVQKGFAFPFLGATSTMHSLLYFEKKPKAPFNIPYWSYGHLKRKNFRVLPFYRRSVTETEEEAILLSGLTGRAVVVSNQTADSIDKIFVNERTPIVEPSDLKNNFIREILDFLVEHSLAMFLPKDQR